MGRGFLVGVLPSLGAWGHWASSKSEGMVWSDHCLGCCPHTFIPWALGHTPGSVWDMIGAFLFTMSTGKGQLGGLFNPPQSCGTGAPGLPGLCFILILLYACSDNHSESQSQGQGRG
jgi:hypothetical protein